VAHGQDWAHLRLCGVKSAAADFATPSHSDVERFDDGLGSRRRPGLGKDEG
jgi:hypothetical protein